MRRSLFLALLALLLAAGWRAAPVLHADPLLQYAPGWNLVSGPDGSHLLGAGGSLYTLQPGDSSYEVFPASSALKGGWGYWAYFPNGGSLMASAGQAAYSVGAVPGQWIMIGNPSATQSLTLGNADLAYTYAAAGGYSSSSSLTVGQGAMVLAQRQVTLNVGAPSPTAGSAAAPTGATVTGGAQTFAGSLTIDGVAAPGGTGIEGRIGGISCGSTTVTTRGQYTLTIAPTAQGCGSSGAQVQFGVTPRFGSEWLLAATVPFQPGASTQNNLNVDLTRLTPEAGNVPLELVTWSNEQVMRVAICDPQLSGSATTAANTAISWWGTASNSGGLAINVISDQSACDNSTPGIAIIAGKLKDPKAIAGTGFIDTNGNVCDVDTACTALKAVVLVNYSVFNSLDAGTQARALAHEIGHGLGLDHAHTCDGGTLMWYNDQCAFPTNHIGVDDILTLNGKVGAATSTNGAPRTVSAAPATTSLFDAVAAADFATETLDLADAGT